MQQLKSMLNTTTTATSGAKSTNLERFLPTIQERS